MSTARSRAWQAEEAFVLAGAGGSRAATRAAFEDVGETCPEVDAALRDFLSGILLEFGPSKVTARQWAMFQELRDIAELRIKTQTVALRTALIRAHDLRLKEVHGRAAKKNRGRCASIENSGARGGGRRKKAG